MKRRRDQVMENMERHMLIDKVKRNIEQGVFVPEDLLELCVQAEKMTVALEGISRVTENFYRTQRGVKVLPDDLFPIKEQIEWIRSLSAEDRIKAVK